MGPRRAETRAGVAQFTGWAPSFLHMGAQVLPGGRPVTPQQGILQALSFMLPSCPPGVWSALLAGCQRIISKVRVSGQGTPSLPSWDFSLPSLPSCPPGVSRNVGICFCNPCLVPCSLNGPPPKGATGTAGRQGPERRAQCLAQRQPSARRHRDSVQGLWGGRAAEGGLSCSEFTQRSPRRVLQRQLGAWRWECYLPRPEVQPHEDGDSDLL